MSATPSSSDRSSLRRFVRLVLFAWGLLTLGASYFAGHYLFLIYHYGFSRVRGEHLHFTQMPKGGPWIVSNADRISEGYSLSFFFGAGLWLAVMFGTFCLIGWLLPELKHPAPKKKKKWRTSDESPIA